MFRLLAILLAVQFGQRPPLTPAETLLAPEILRAITGQAPVPEAALETTGADRDAGSILLTCREGQCGTAERAARKLSALVAAKQVPQPPRSIRVASAFNASMTTGVTAVIHIAESPDRPLLVMRGLWSTASIGDEVVEMFARHGGRVVEARAFENLGQLRLDPYGVSTTTIVVNPAMSNDHAAVAAAASAYFLATLPNAGAEALLSHLTVGAHARLAEDGRRAVAQMGNQQRASADVLIMFGQAIEREQRRMRSFERFMPEPVDPMLRSRLADMEKGITSVWTSMGITSSPFVPAAERIRGRGSEDRRVPRRTAAALPAVDVPGQFGKFDNAADIVYELGNFIDGARSISDIRDAVSAEFGSVPLPPVVEYFERLAKAGAIALR